MFGLSLSLVRSHFIYKKNWAAYAIQSNKCNRLLKFTQHMFQPSVYTQSIYTCHTYIRINIQMNANKYTKWSDALTNTYERDSKIERIKAVFCLCCLCVSTLSLCMRVGYSIHLNDVQVCISRMLVASLRKCYSPITHGIPL